MKYTNQPITTTAAVDNAVPIKSDLNEPGHSPLPWFRTIGNEIRIQQGQVVRTIASIEKDNMQIPMETQIENAKLICLAVNSHAALVEALERALPVLIRAQCGDSNVNHQCDAIDAKLALNEALKLARGEG